MFIQRRGSARTSFFLVFSILFEAKCSFNKGLIKDKYKLGAYYLEIIPFLNGDSPKNENRQFTQHHVIPNMYEYVYEYVYEYIYEYET